MNLKQMKIASISILILLLLAGAFAMIVPFYNVFSNEMRGKADLMEARQNRQIQIEEAQANLEAERLNAQAEVERAKGMAQAMEIENNQLTSEYIHYLWVRSNRFNEHTTIYVPTEANMPILEAGRVSSIGE